MIPNRLAPPFSARSCLTSDLIDKFDDPAQADALTSVHRKIDVTTNAMQENIALLLENDAKV
jgi:hypothetical protein